MKRKSLLFAGTSLAAAGLAIFTAFSWHNEASSTYHPSAKIDFKSGDGDSENANDAGQWWFNRVKNQVTGQLDLEDMARVSELSNATFAQNRNTSTERNADQQSTASASWTELGPDNVGGRTRAILIDNQDPTHQHMFAGGVSGGLWESNDGANNWHKAGNFFSQSGVTITVVTIAQAINGDIYVGTGEGNFYYLFGFGAGAFVGGGIYKSTDDGATWNVLPSTVPSTQNSTTTAWLSVNKIQCDPSDANRLYAGTNKGPKISTDGGATWTAPSGITSTNLTTDVEQSADGQNVIFIVAAKPYLSTDHGATFVNVLSAGSGFPTAALGRTTVAISPQDKNYVYALCAANGASNTLYGLYVSLDGGLNWTQASGPASTFFDPFNSGGSGQGTYDNYISVDPTNKNRALICGIDLWEWDLITTNPIAGQWSQKSTGFESLFNPSYVHADKHCIVWHPTQPNVFFIGSDGGVFRTQNNGTSYQAMNSGYNVTQCYSVGIENTSGLRNQAVAGCQDNGTQFIDGNGNTAMSAKHINGGDGAQCEISFLNPLAVFSTVYFGALDRSNNRGASQSSFYDTRITGLTGFGTGSFASFTTPIRLWESMNDLLSGDSVLVVNDTLAQNKNVTNGDSTHYSGVIDVPYPTATPAATIILNSVMFIVGTDTLFSDGAGALSNSLTNAGTGTVTTAGAYSITYNTPPVANRIIKAVFNYQYGVGTVFTVSSNVSSRNLTYTTTSTVMPGDTVKIQDIYQSHLAVGFTGNNGIWVTRQAINFSVAPLWIKIGGSHSIPDPYSGEADVLCWSPDGNTLYVGTGGQSPNGNLYRFDNVGMITDSADGDVDNAAVANPTCKVRCTRIANFGARAITGIDIDPNNPAHMVVTLGNYGNAAYVYYGDSVNTAPSAANTTNFTNKTGTLATVLGGVPVYSCCFDKYDPDRVLIGTEHGMFETGNITAAVTWAPANAGLDNVPVDMIRQQRWDPWLVPNAGCFYIGTHGRGMWRDDSSFQAPTGISNPVNPGSSGNAFIDNHDLRVFPNPVVDNSHVSFLLGKAGDATVQIFDLEGKLVYSHVYEQLDAGANTVEFETGEMVKGTYIIVVNQGEKRVGAGRFIKMN